ncbi:MAG: hypothetical protein JSV36_05795, partial [Anaerolineae bacterium]
MRDLEIRGAGDILGRRQHGHISAVGFDLYTRLLAQAVCELKGEADGHLLSEDIAYLMPLREAMQISLPIPVSLPADYVADDELRLRLYRRMAGLARMSEIDELAAELTDRFGPLPPPAANLIYQLRLKVLGTAAGVQSLSADDRRLVLRVEGLEKQNRAAVQARLRGVVPGVIVGRRQIWLPMADEERIWRAELIGLLRSLQAYTNSVDFIP